MLIFAQKKVLPRAVVPFQVRVESSIIVKANTKSKDNFRTI